MGESSAAASIPRVVSSAVPQNSSTKLHVTNLCIVWGSAGLVISFSASRSSGSGRRSAIITASVTLRCCGRGQRKTSVKVHFPGGPVSPPDRLTPYDRTVPLRNVLQKSCLQSYQRWTMTQPFRRSRRDTDRDQEILLRIRQGLQQIKRRLIDKESPCPSHYGQGCDPSRIYGKAVER